MGCHSAKPQSRWKPEDTDFLPFINSQEKRRKKEPLAIHLLREIFTIFFNRSSLNKPNPSLYFFTTHHYLQELPPAERHTRRHTQQEHTQRLPRRCYQDQSAPQQPAQQRRRRRQHGQPQLSHPVFRRIVNILMLFRTWMVLFVRELT